MQPATLPNSGGGEINTAWVEDESMTLSALIRKTSLVKRSYLNHLKEINMLNQKMPLYFK
jgi:hypothetical protein